MQVNNSEKDSPTVHKGSIHYLDHVTMTKNKIRTPFTVTEFVTLYPSRYIICVWVIETTTYDKLLKVPKIKYDDFQN